jgi:NAD(P)-dependent dehydrogenase (short-subunit alcohol dehydrogenase family)
MSRRLEDRVIAVTGASGIAAAGARRFADEGAAVFVISRRAEPCAALTDEIRATGGVCDWAVADLQDEPATVAAFARCAEAFDRVDGLFAVAGGSGRRFGDGPIHEIPLEGWDETLALNGRPPFLSAREATRIMLDQPPSQSGSRGSIVLVTSVLASHPSSLFATHAYAAVKGAEVSLTRAMAAYYGEHLIRVNAIAPGLIRTPMAERAATDPTSVAYASKKQPLAAGLLPPEDVVAAGLFLLSDEARYVTGQVIDVDGGWGVAEAVP